MCLFQLSDGFDNFYTKSELEKKRLNFFLGNTVNYELRVPLLISPRHCLLHMYASKTFSSETLLTMSCEYPCLLVLDTVYCTCMRVKQHFSYNILPLNISQKVLFSDG